MSKNITISISNSLMSNHWIKAEPKMMTHKRCIDFCSVFFFGMTITVLNWQEVLLKPERKRDRQTEEERYAKNALFVKGSLKFPCRNRRALLLFFQFDFAHPSNCSEIEMGIAVSNSFGLVLCAFN